MKLPLSTIGESDEDDWRHHRNLSPVGRNVSRRSESSDEDDFRWNRRAARERTRNFRRISHYRHPGHDDDSSDQDRPRRHESRKSSRYRDAREDSATDDESYDRSRRRRKSKSRRPSDIKVGNFDGKSCVET